MEIGPGRMKGLHEPCISFALGFRYEGVAVGSGLTGWWDGHGDVGVGRFAVLGVVITHQSCDGMANVATLRYYMLLAKLEWG